MIYGRHVWKARQAKALKDYHFSLKKENDQLKAAAAQLLAEIANLKLALKESEEAEVEQLNESQRDN